VTSPGTYYLTTTNSCGGIYSDTVRVQPHAPIPLDLGIDRNKCNSDTLHLNAPAGFLNYQWSNDYNISSTTAQNVIVNPLTDTAYYIQAEKTPGCFAYDTVRIHVNTSPPINLGADRSFCSGDSAVFDAGSGFDQYTWSNGGNSRQMSVRTAGLYSVVALTAEGCKSYDTVRVVNVFSKPVVSLDQTGFLCFGNSRVLDAGIFASYAWNDGTTSQKLTARGIGTYAVQVTDNHGCRGGDTTRITAILPLPSGFLPPDTLLCSYDKIFITALRPYKSYQWSNGASASSLNISQPGTYWLQVKDENGCEGRDTIIINPKDCMKGCYVPTAFSPNSDGRNDLFRPMLFGHVKKYHFIVYSRWGQVIFETTELNRAWDGTVAGTLQQSNVFTWMCTYQFEGEEMKTEKGTVMLVR
jgi:gliding motility-associated-like protein